MAGRAEDYSRAIGNAAPGMSRAIVDAEVRFRLDNAAGSAAMNQNFAQTIVGDLGRGALVEFARDNVGRSNALREGDVFSFLYARRLACGSSLASNCPKTCGKS